ncbi:MAG: alpha/beta hydrolase [Ilumatobacteraceae bacterium]|nr:alpha/beta hydrolase [Ilumatobacteraceae bacterium]
MAVFEHGSVRIDYSVEGDGFPVFAIAPGGMHSANDIWNRMPWNPRVRLTDRYSVIGMDQRNAGASTAPVSGNDGWSTYTSDQLALLDHLGIERCHLLGMCIGGPYEMALMTAAPERFTCAVMLQPAGIVDDHAVMRDLYDGWAADLAPTHPEADAAAWSSFGDNMWSADFLVSSTRADVAACTTPLLVMMGNDQWHPQAVSREIVDLAPNARLVERWKDDEVLAETDATIKAFLAEHTPADAAAAP